MNRGKLVSAIALSLGLGICTVAQASELGDGLGPYQPGVSEAPGLDAPGTLISDVQVIVKYKDTKSLDADLQSMQSLLSTSLGSMSAADMKTMRAEVEQSRKANGIVRAAALASTHKVQLGHDRVLASGADLLTIRAGSRNLSADAVALMLQADPQVEYAEVNARMYPMATPNDTRYNEQWHYFESTAGLNLPQAWDITTGSGTVVAVLDTGIVPHSDLNGNVIAGYDFVSDSASARDGNGRDSNPNDEGDWYNAGECGQSQGSGSSWHGTHVAGTVAAVTNNNSGVAGVAYGAKISPVRVLAKCGGSLADIADAIIWASGGSVSGVPGNANPADVINMSLGGGGSCGSTYQSAINTAVGNGTVVVVAAGNSNTNASNARPANCSNVVTVASLDRQANRAFYSNYGSVVDVSAPGGETSTSSNGVLSTLNSGSTTQGSQSYAFYQGTSMAAPHVAGVAALMRAVNSSMTPAQIETELKNTARTITGSCSGGCGDGLVDALAAVQAADGGTPPPPPPPGGSLDNGDTVSNLSGSTGDFDFWTIDVPAGATNLQVVMSGGSGDADLYLRFGSQPTTSSYDCRPYNAGNNETCTVANPSTGTYHIGIRAYSSYSGVSFTVSYDEPSSGGGGGGTVENISASQGNWARYYLDVPAGMGELKVDISGGTGDADLYVNFGSQSSTSNYDCRPYLNGNNETCTFNNPAAGRWHIDIRAYRTFSGVKLDAYYTP